MFQLPTLLIWLSFTTVLRCWNYVCGDSIIHIASFLYIVIADPNFFSSLNVIRWSFVNHKFQFPLNLKLLCSPTYCKSDQIKRWSHPDASAIQFASHMHHAYYALQNCITDVLNVYYIHFCMLSSWKCMSQSLKNGFSEAHATKEILFLYEVSVLVHLFNRKHSSNVFRLFARSPFYTGNVDAPSDGYFPRFCSKPGHFFIPIGSSAFSIASLIPRRCCCNFRILSFNSTIYLFFGWNMWLNRSLPLWMLRFHWHREHAHQPSCYVSFIHGIWKLRGKAMIIGNIFIWTTISSFCAQRWDSNSFKYM